MVSCFRITFKIISYFIYCKILGEGILMTYSVILTLSNHCWLSFSGFAEAYNDIFEDRITKYGHIIGGPNKAGN